LRETEYDVKGSVRLTKAGEGGERSGGVVD